MMMTYKALLRGDQLIWVESPPEMVADGIEVPVHVTFLQTAEDEAALEQRRERVLRLLEELSASNAFAEIEDPVAWQREIRRDRSLPWDDLV